MTLNDDREVFFNALEDQTYNVMCPVKLLIIHAMRVGQLRGTLDDVLTATSNRVDGVMQ